MLVLLLAALALASAPVLDRLLTGRPSWSRGVHDLARVVVFGVVLVHVAPHGIALAGALAVPALVAGVLAASLLERPLEHEHPASLATVAAALGVHQLIDGVALAHPDEGPLLAVAVLVHTIPVALLAWRFASARSLRLGVGTLVGMGAATAAGFVLAREGATSDTAVWPSLVECFLGGALVHVLAHRHEDQHEAGSALASGLGATLGVLAVAWLALAHPTAGRYAEELALVESLATLLHWLAPPVAVGAALAALARGARPDAATAVAVVVAGTTVFGAAAGVALAVAAGAVLWLAPGDAPHEHEEHGHDHGDGHEDDHDHASPGRTSRVPGLGWRGAAPMLAASLPWLLTGIATAAVIEPSLRPDALSTTAPWQVGLAAVAGLALLDVPPLGALPLALVATHKGVSPGLAVGLVLAALLATGRTRAQRAGLAAVGVLLGAALDPLLPTVADLHGLAPADGRAAVAALLVAAVALLVQRGLDGFVEPVVGPHPHGHDHP